MATKPVVWDPLLEQSVVLALMGDRKVVVEEH
jgi:hypothetical protein